MSDPSHSNDKSGGWSEAEQILAARKQLVNAEHKRRKGQLSDASRMCKSLLAHDPTYLGALQTLGLVALAEADYRQAITCFTTAASQAPGDKTNHINLASAWLGLELPEMAAVSLREASLLDADDIEIDLMWGDVHARNREYEHAIRHLTQACKKGHPMARLRLAEAKMVLGKFEAARGILLALHSERPDWLAVINLLHHLPSEMVDVDFTAAVSATKQQPNETKETFLRNRGFLEGAILDRLGRYEQAWEKLVWANEQSVRNVARFASGQSIKKPPSLVLPSRPHSGGNKTVHACLPLFILGASRSGKTTLESMLAQDKRFCKGYENSHVSRAIARASQKAGLPTLRELSLKELYPSFANEYLSRLPIDLGHQVFTTTYPGALQTLVAVSEAVPGARFVLIKRDHWDTGLRIFMKNYRKGFEFSYRLESIFEYLDNYDQASSRLVDFLGSKAIALTYEELVKDPNASIARVYALCGIGSPPKQVGPPFSDVGAATPYRTWMERELATLASRN